MTTNPPNPSTPDAEQMLAYVEGDLDTPAELRFRRSLAGAPDVLARLDAMRRDRAALRATLLRDPVVPRSLERRTQEVIAREALLAPRKIGSRAPSTVIDDLDAPTGADRLSGLGGLDDADRPRRRWNSSLLITPLSMAAALALVAGGIMLTLRGGPASRGGGASASARSVDESGSAQALAAVEGLADVPGSSSDRLASGAPTPAGVAGTDALNVDDPLLTLEAPAAWSLAEATGGPRVPLDAAPSLSPFDGSTRLVPGVVGRADLMALAEQHRLALRIAASKPDELVAALDEVSALSALGALDQAPWRVRPDLADGLAGAIGVSMHDNAAPGGSTPPGPDAIASAPTPTDAPGIADTDRWLLRPSEDALAVYMAEVDLTEAALEALRREFEQEDALLNRPPPRRVGFAVLQDPISSVLSQPRMIVPSRDTLWWHQTPSAWGRRTLVPVIIEQR